MSRAVAAITVIAATLLAAPVPAPAQSEDPQPFLVSSYLGGSAVDEATGVAIDAQGFTWVVGHTTSPDFPVSGSRPGARRGPGDAFVAKVAQGSGAVVFAMLLGGSGDDAATGVATDAAGNGYVTGWTDSADFPTTDGAFDRTNGRSAGCEGADCIDAFVVKIAPDGSSLLYSTFLGGEHQDFGYGIDVTPGGDAAVAGLTASFSFPLLNAFSPRKQTGFEGFVTRFAADGGSLVYSSYIGGSGGDSATDVALGPDGEAYVVGSTASTNFHVLNAFQPANAGGGSPTGDFDAFLLRLSPTGALVFSTYLGGRGTDVARAVAVDSGTAVPAAVYVAGGTTSSDFPTAAAAQAASGGGQDGFLARFPADGSAPEFSTYVGGSADDEALAVASDGAVVDVGGVTASGDFRVAAPWQASCGCGLPTNATDGFLGVYDRGGAVARLSYYGGRSDDRVAAIAGAGMRIAIAGSTFSSDFPLVKPFQATCRCGPGTDKSAFVAWTSGFVIFENWPTVERVTAFKKPFRLEIEGARFQPGAKVRIGGVEVGGVEVVSDTLIRVAGGKSLKRRFPRGEVVPVVVMNPDGGTGGLGFSR